MELWEKTIEALQTAVEPYDFMHWIRPIRCDTVDDQNQEIVLRVPDDSHGRWLEENFMPQIRRTLRTFTEQDYDIRLSYPDGTRPAEPTPVPVVEAAPVQEGPDQLIGRYRFDAFVEGTTNRFALAAARAAAEHPGVRYNPLFVYGGVGLGKTHLLHAVGHEVRRLRPGSRVLYVTSETFVNDLIEAIRTHRMREFRARYREGCDVLLVDDIQFLAGKERTQEEFFHLFNTLHSSRKQIVLSGDQVPQSIPDMEDRLRSRLQWGLITNIHPPSFETRVAILKRKAEADRVEVPDDVAMLVARHISRNVRELEGALMRLEASAGIFDRPITLDLAKEVLGDLVEESLHRVSTDQVMKLVAQDFRISLTDMKGPRRHRLVTVPRQVAMFLVRKLTEHSLPQIGQAFGGRDHTTVINAVRRVEERRAADPDFRKRVEALDRQLTG